MESPTRLRRRHHRSDWRPIHTKSWLSERLPRSILNVSGPSAYIDRLVVLTTGVTIFSNLYTSSLRLIFSGGVPCNVPTHTTVLGSSYHAPGRFAADWHTIPRPRRPERAVRRECTSPTSQRTLAGGTCSAGCPVRPDAGGADLLRREPGCTQAVERA